MFSVTFMPFFRRHSFNVYTSKIISVAFHFDDSRPHFTNRDFDKIETESLKAPILSVPLKQIRLPLRDMANNNNAGNS
jgi:hypothetical protein